MNFLYNDDRDTFIYVIISTSRLLCRRVFLNQVLGNYCTFLVIFFRPSPWFVIIPNVHLSYDISLYNIFAEKTFKPRNYDTALKVVL